MRVLPQKQKGEKMINKVAFTGKETRLAKSIEKAAEKVEATVIKASSILQPLPKAEAPVSEVVYTSPFANIIDTAKSVVSTPTIDRTGLDFFA